MTKERIKEIADFFYSSDEVSDVPIRITAETGQYTGFNFPKDGLIRLLEILNESKELKKDLLSFRDEYEEYGE